MRLTNILLGIIATLVLFSAIMFYRFLQLEYITPSQFSKAQWQQQQLARKEYEEQRKIVVKENINTTPKKQVRASYAVKNCFVKPDNWNDSQTSKLNNINGIFKINVCKTKKAQS